MMLDQVLKAKRADPKFMKTGGTKMLEDNDSMAGSSVGGGVQFGAGKKGEKAAEENDALRIEQLAKLQHDIMNAKQYDMSVEKAMA